MREDVLKLEKGRQLTIGGKVWTVRHRLGDDKVIAERDGEDPRIFTTGEIMTELGRPLQGRSPEDEPPSRVDARELEAVEAADWAVAQRRLAIVDGLRRLKNRTRADVEAAARLARVHVATVYEWMNDYEDAGRRTSGLIPRKRGPKPGSRRLPDAVEKVIADCIEGHYLDEQRHSVDYVYRKTKGACAKAGLKAPSADAVRSRVGALDAGLVLRRRGQRDVARNKLTPIRGRFPDQRFPLSVVQIDHTLVDVIFVDEVHRLPIGRAFLTIAIDVHTRMVVGFHLSYEHPSFASVGMCIAVGMLPKAALLVAHDVPGSWPVHGSIGTLHADNAREFRGEKLRRACEEHRIDLQLRPVKTPHWGGHIERLMNTSSKEFHKIRGTTFSNPRQRQGYDSEAKASMTLREFEGYLVDWIVNKYHADIHSALGMTPLHKLRLSLEGGPDAPAVGVLEEPAQDEAALRVDFMPWEKRTVQPYGVLIDGVHYWDEVLKDKIELEQKESHIIRFDPRDMSVVYFWDVAVGAHFPIPCRELSRRPFSRHENRAARAKLLEEGRRNFDEDELFATMDRLSRRAEAAVEKTKAARRASHRKATTEDVARRRGAEEAARDRARQGPDTAAGAGPPGGGDEDMIEPFADFGSMTPHREEYQP